MGKHFLSRPMFIVTIVNIFGFFKPKFEVYKQFGKLYWHCCPIFVLLLTAGHGTTFQCKNTRLFITVCPRSSDPFYIVSYYIKWVATSWTYSITERMGENVSMGLSWAWLRDFKPMSACDQLEYKTGPTGSFGLNRALQSSSIHGL